MKVTHVLRGGEVIYAGTVNRKVQGRRFSQIKCKHLPFTIPQVKAHYCIYPMSTPDCMSRAGVAGKYAVTRAF